jgi:magnesium-transporting ATPase (P-type)
VIPLTDVSRLPVEEVYRTFGTSPSGLSADEVRQRLERNGPNVLVERKGETVGHKFLVSIRDLFSVLLIVAAVLAAVSGELRLSVVILVVVIVNTIMSVFQEWRAERAMEALRSWMPLATKVMRDGELRMIPARELVTGDIIVLEEGDRIPADGRVVECYELWVNNVPLTGESEPRPRTAEHSAVSSDKSLDVPNFVFMSTTVARGSGRAVVLATGMGTRFGRIAGLTQQIPDEPSPLQEEIARTAKYDFVIAVAVGFAFLLASVLWLHVSLAKGILFMIGVMISCVPEGLQVTVSTALTISMVKMAQENVLVRRLSAVQTLGSVTVICTDKTGTITKGEMTVTRIWVPGNDVRVSGTGYEPDGELQSSGVALDPGDVPAVDRLLEACAACNAARVEPPTDAVRAWHVIGDPTDGALLVAAMKDGIHDKAVLVRAPIVHRLPFDSERKRMTTVHRADGALVSYTKGAPRSIIDRSTHIEKGGSRVPLEGEALEALERKVHELAGEGLRVVAVARRELPADARLEAADDLERDLTVLGLVAMRDPPRPEVKDAVERAKRAGIKVVIITGDYGPTAQVIAQDVGIVSRERARVIRGIELGSMDDPRIAMEVRRGDVIFARVSPDQKHRIVKALKAAGEVVAVTGDGANDAPSLREADIGVAMGASGTDVAREAADMVLLDDSFASIVKAVESGRAAYENVRRFIVFAFSHNWAELIPYLLYIVLAIPLPLLVVQILAIDLMIDVIPSLALSREPPEPGIMLEPPRSVKERIFHKRAIARSLFTGLIIAVGVMGACLATWHAGGWSYGQQLSADDPVYMRGTTMVFAGIAIAQIGTMLALRTTRASLLSVGLRSNGWVWASMVAQVGIVSALVFVPAAGAFFGTVPLTAAEYAILATLAVLVLLADESRKAVVRLLRTGREPGPQAALARP